MLIAKCRSAIGEDAPFPIASVTIIFSRSRSNLGYIRLQSR